MGLSPEIRQQLRVALYSSLAVSVLTTTPVFMMTRVDFAFYPWMLVFTTGMSIGMWAINIALYHYTRGRRVVRYGLSYLVSLLFAVGVMHGWAMPRTGGFGSYSNGFYFHIILFVAVDTVLLIIQDLVVVRGQNADLRTRNVEAANLLLRQQVQPHFLFNSLSTLKSLIRFSPADAEEYVVKLSGFLRSSLATHGSTLVKVEEELGLCRDYLEMQRIRFGEALQFSVAVTGTGFLPVFALQGLLENAIKHNVLTKERPLWIRIEGDEHRITVVNNLQRRGQVEKGGTGLQNLQERYKALGGGAVVVEEVENLFSVSINVFAHDHRHHRG